MFTLSRSSIPVLTATCDFVTPTCPSKARARARGDEDAACLLCDLVGLARDLGIAFDLGKETCFESFLK